MKIKKIVIGTLVLTLLIFSLYAYKLHALAVEGNKIFEQRCLVVNPPLISYKNYFLNFADAVKHPDKVSTELAVGYFLTYLDDLRAYAPKEVAWLETQRAFLDRWDFKLIEPWYIKEAGEYQYRMYEGYRDEALALIEIVDSDGNKSEIHAKFDAARTKRNDNSQLYFDLVNEASEFKDWRKIFGSVPFPGACTDEVLKIPDTTGALDPDPARVKEPDITG
ncbi:MAG: hypothetical protein WC797_04820 [Candidatus Paceibacterota bacterium]|jgi:hypothetical protein